jgi:hypothetical protein
MQFINITNIHLDDAHHIYAKPCLCYIPIGKMKKCSLRCTCLHHDFALPGLG